MIIDVSKTIFDSSFAGLGNFQNASATYAMSSQSVGPNEIRLITVFTIGVSNANSISSIQVNFGNVETVWRPVIGFLQKTIKLDIGFGLQPNYDLLVIPYYYGTLLNITIIVADDTGLANTIPAVNFNFRVNTYNAPF